MYRFAYCCGVSRVFFRSVKVGLCGSWSQEYLGEGLQNSQEGGGPKTKGGVDRGGSVAAHEFGELKNDAGRPHSTF